MRPIHTLTSLLVFFLSCSSLLAQQIAQTDAYRKQKTDSLLSTLTLEEKIGQMFIAALYTNKGPEEIAKVRKWVKEEQIGGLILMQDNPVQHVKLIETMNADSRVPLLIGLDGEWGLYQRFFIAKKFPWALTLGAIRDKQKIKNLAASIAADCKRMGIHWDFAPVVDVNTNPKNPIIGNRSFGSDIQNVIASAGAFLSGLQENGVMGSLKHFPGHGDTSTDSHLDLPVVDHSEKRLYEVELAPYQSLMKDHPAGIMVSHLYIPALDKKMGLPASLSPVIITDLLRNKLGYQGLIITDALNMGAITSKYKPGEADVLAFKAGNDIMLFSDDVAKAKKEILAAVRRGEISEKRVDESVRRILNAKLQYGVMAPIKTDTDYLTASLHTRRHDSLAKSLYADAMTLLKRDSKHFPLRTSHKIAYTELEEAGDMTFFSILKNRLPLYPVQKESIAKLNKNTPLIIAVCKDNSTAYKPYTLSEETIKIIESAAKSRPVTLVLFGSPYGLKNVNLKNINTVLLAYEANQDAYEAAADALGGQVKIDGTLPVEVNNTLKQGQGVSYLPK